MDLGNVLIGTVNRKKQLFLMCVTVSVVTRFKFYERSQYNSITFRYEGNLNTLVVVNIWIAVLIEKQIS